MRNRGFRSALTVTVFLILSSGTTSWAEESTSANEEAPSYVTFEADVGICDESAEVEAAASPCKSVASTACSIEKIDFSLRRCTQCPSFNAMDLERRKYLKTSPPKPTVTAKAAGRCIEKMDRWACLTSTFAKFNLKQRYQKILADAQASNPSFPAAIVPCLAARETGTLEPVSITCQTLGSSAVGLGQITETTFLDLFDARRNQAPDRAVKRKVCEETWLMPHNCGVDGLKRDPRYLFREVLTKDPRLQVRVMIEVLERKLLRSRVQRAKEGRERWNAMLTAYYGGAGDRLYAKDILECVDCLKNKKMDSVECLGKAGPGRVRENRCAIQKK